MNKFLHHLKSKGYEINGNTAMLLLSLIHIFAKKLGIQPLYTGGDLRKVTSVINSQRYYGATGTENK